MKNITIFAPEDIQYDFTSLGLGVFKLPGDLPTGTVLKLLALGDKGIMNTYEEIVDIIIELFKIKHGEEAKKLKNIGPIAVTQIITHLYTQIYSAAGEAKKLTDQGREEN